MKKQSHDEQGGILIAVLTIAIILSIVFYALFGTVSGTVRQSGKKRVNTTAIHMAEAGKEDLYARIRSGAYSQPTTSWVTVINNQAFNNGTYTVSCSTNAAFDTIAIRSVGLLQGTTKTIEVMAAITPKINIGFPPVRGAVTARTSVLVSGNINVDGREHDTNGVHEGDGLVGVSTCGTLSVSGSATVGGTNTAPVSKGALDAVKTSVAEENAPVTASLASPEAFLGVPPGSLDAFKTTSQVTPIKGIRYITSDEVGPLHLDTSFGILIVHNTTGNATLQINDGVFKGLIITDQMERFTGNALIIGAVVTLIPSDVATLGVGTANILYSTKILQKLKDYCNNIPRRVEEFSWKED